jgi:hypothetical protein
VTGAVIAGLEIIVADGHLPIHAPFIDPGGDTVDDVAVPGKGGGIGAPHRSADIVPPHAGVAIELVIDRSFGV